MKDSVKTKATKKKVARKAGDVVERVGEKAIKMGATETGRKIYKAGNKLEHSQDKK